MSYYVNCIKCNHKIFISESQMKEKIEVNCPGCGMSMILSVNKVKKYDTKQRVEENTEEVLEEETIAPIDDHTESEHQEISVQEPKSFSGKLGKFLLEAAKLAYRGLENMQHQYDSAQERLDGQGVDDWSEEELSKKLKYTVNDYEKMILRQKIRERSSKYED